MKTGALWLAGVLTGASWFAGAAAAPADRQAALASFQAFLDGLGQRDPAAMRAHSLPGGQATLMRDGKPVQMTLAELAERVSRPGKDSQLERLIEPLVRVDGDVAIVWAPFELLINGEIAHCGRDVATLVRIEGQWLVAAIVDNSRTEDCRTRHP